MSMNPKRLVTNIIWAIAGVFLLFWLWRWVQAQGGFMVAFNRLFPGLVTVTPAPRIEVPVPPTRPPVDVPAPAPAPPVRPAPAPTPRPEFPTGIHGNDRLPWENYRVRSEVISALRRDIARVEGMERRWADTMPEVIAVGGVNNYLNLQRERLHRAMTIPVLPADIRRPTPAPLGPAPLIRDADALRPVTDTPFFPTPAIAAPTPLWPAPAPTPAPAPAPTPAPAPAPTPAPLGAAQIWPRQAPAPLRPPLRMHQTPAPLRPAPAPAPAPVMVAAPARPEHDPLFGAALQE